MTGTRLIKKKILKKKGGEKTTKKNGTKKDLIHAVDLVPKAAVLLPSDKELSVLCVMNRRKNLIGQIIEVTSILEISVFLTRREPIPPCRWTKERRLWMRD